MYIHVKLLNANCHCQVGMNKCGQWGPVTFGWSPDGAGTQLRYSIYRK